MNQKSEIRAIVLAAGRGSRMGSDIPKVLIPLKGKPVLQYVLNTLAESGVTKTVIVVSPAANGPIREIVGDSFTYAVQEEQLGSGHAVISARDAARDADTLVIMCGDSPLFKVETIRALIDVLTDGDAVIALSSAVLDDPTGYGRILRSSSGEVTGVAEEKNATAEQKAIREINGGAYSFDAAWLWDNIDLLTRNEAGEYNLTEVVGVAISQGRKVVTIPCGADEVAGINTPTQLQEAEKILSARGLH